MHASALERNIVKAFVYALLALLGVPGVTWWFAHHATAQTDAKIFQNLMEAVERDEELQEAAKQEVRAFLQTAPPPSSACRASPAEEGRSTSVLPGICAPYSEFWQFHVAGQLAQWTLWGSLAVLCALGVLGALAFVRRRLRTLCFVLGWRLLLATCVVSLWLQGAQLVWLSFWVPAFVWQAYYPPLMAVVALCVVCAALYVMRLLFQRIPPRALKGALLKHEEARALRCGPSNAEEEAVVLQHFPPLRFELKGGACIQLRYAGFVLPDGADMPWERVHKLHFEETYFSGTYMVIFHPEKKGLGHAKTKIKLRGFKGKGQEEAFHAAVVRYWQRFQRMRASHPKHAAAKHAAAADALE